MKIAISSNKNDIHGLVEERFGMSKHLLFLDIDDDTLELKGVKGIEMPGLEEDAAGLIAEEDCEALISGVLDTKAFYVLADKQITRYNGAGLSVNEAIEKMHRGLLSLFSHAENEEGCNESLHMERECSESHADKHECGCECECE
jgi:predicted Fe-Mo cluster-binding NifX family protein